MSTDTGDTRPQLRIGLLIGLVAVLVLLCCGGGTAAFFLDGLNGATKQNNADNGGCGQPGQVLDTKSDYQRFGSFDNEQMHNAAIIISVGQKLKAPPRAWVIAIATAIQESNLVDLGNLGARNDHDSLGLFQQRPSQGWGTRAQVMDPVYAAQKFYTKLLSIPGWDKLALTDAAQRVQKSAYPDAYAKHESAAANIVNQLAAGAARAVGSLVSMQCSLAAQISAAGWTVPVQARIVSGFRPPSRPTHNGVDLGVPKGTPIHAANDGVVRVAECEPSTGNCNVDGSLSTPGCGWYVDIEHAGGVITRYCHMVRKPFVTVGQTVKAGQVIGLSGTSGNSSGPHVHFEVHLNSDSSSRGAVNPVPFMRNVGAPLGVPAP